MKKRPIFFSSWKEKLLQRNTFSFPLQKKNNTKINYFHQNGDFSTSNRNSSFFQKCQTETVGTTFCVHSEVGNEGIGIERFLQGKNFLITGATGFLAKGNVFNYLTIYILNFKGILYIYLEI
jgi:hypothetical protein